MHSQKPAADRRMIWNEFNSLRRYVPLLLLACLFGGIFGYLGAIFRPLVYHATAVLRVPPGRRAGKTAHKDLLGPQQEFLTELVLLQSDSLSRRVIRELNLTRRVDFMGYVPPDNLDVEGRELLIQQAIARLHQGFTVTVLPETELAQLSYTSTNPKLAAAIVNHFMDDFLEDRFERRYRGAGRGEQLLGDRLAALRDEFVTSQFRLLALQEELQTPGFSPRRNQIAVDLAGLSAQARAANLDRLADGDRVALLKAQRLKSGRTAAGRQAGLTSPPLNLPRSTAGDGRGPAPVDSTVIEQEQIRNRLNDALATQAQQSALLGPKNPAAQAAAALVASYEEELAGADSLILTVAERRAAVDAREQAGIEGELKERQQEALSLEPAVREYTVLERKYVFARVLYYRFLTRLRSATLDAGLAQSDIMIVDRAEPPAFAVYSGALPDTIGGAVLSLVLAFALVRVRRFRQSLLMRVEQLERITGLPALATLPQLSKFVLTEYADLLARGRTLGAAPPGRDQFVDGMFDLAWAIAPRTKRRGAARILLTSTSPGEGKTSISAALALTLAHGGRRTLLIDADMHRPMIAGRLGLKERVGLSTVVANGASLAQAVQRIANAPNLDVLTSGPMPPNPDRVLASGEMRAMLAEADRDYDVIILDAPPVLAVQDALVLAQLAHDVVWVMRDMDVRIWLTRRTRKLLEKAGAPVRGLVINGTKLPRKEQREPVAVTETSTTAAG